MVSARAFADNWLGRYRGQQRLIDRRAEAAAMIAADAASRRGLSAIRQQMQAAGLGRLGNGLGQTSDMQRGRIHRRGDGGFSASGVIYVRSGSERTRGAITSYLEGATITPKRGRWLWIPTDEAPRLVGSGKGRKRLTPEVYREMGEPLGPLIVLRSVNGHPLMAVRNVGKSETGQKSRVRSLTKSGRPRKGDRLKELAVLFVAIPRTSRAARVRVRMIMRQVQTEMPQLYQQALARTVN